MVTWAPVVLEPIEETVPDPLGVPNWTFWSDGPPKAVAKVFSAVNSNSASYRKHHDLVARATTWQELNRPKHLLLGNRDRAEDAARHLEQVERDLLTKPDPVTRDFVRASVARNTRRRFPLWATAIAVVVAITAFAVTVTVKTSASRSRTTTWT